MTEEVKNAQAGASAQAPATKKRRGISNETKAVSALKFHEKDAAQNGLFIGHLAEVRVDWSTNAESKDFPGIPVPRLTFHFESEHANVAERRNAYHTLFPVASNIDTIEGGKDEWKVNQVLSFIKHMLDVLYLKGRQLTDAEIDALTIPFVDCDDNGEYIAVDPEEVVAGYRAIFDACADMLNGQFSEEGKEASGKPCYKTADGKGVKLWMKLLRAKKNKGEWRNVTANGDLAFDPFIGNGLIELVVKDKMPSILKVDTSKESIIPQETKKQPSMPSMGAMGGVAVDPTNMGFGGSEDAMQAAGIGMPF